MCAEKDAVGQVWRCMSECVCVCWGGRGLGGGGVVTEHLLCSVLKVGLYIMKWNVIYKTVCVCVCVCV